MSQFTFLPWVRNRLTAKAALASVPTGAPKKLSLPVNLAVSVAGGSPATVTLNADLHGPGSVIGINAEAVLKTLPQAGEQQYPSLLVAAVEFYEEDLPWRYSPPAPEPTGTGMNAPHVAPWCCLLVLEDGSKEYSEAEQGSGPLPVIEVPDAANFPPANQLWLWAHVQVNKALDTPTTPESFLNGELSRNPDIAFSRIMGARRLRANTAYRAFLVPSYEAGRQAGLGITPNVDADLLAWASGMTARKFPVYYQWTFRTGAEGDFESLARRLRPVSLPDFGSQPVAVHVPVGSLGTQPSSADWLINLPGVMRPLGAVPRPPGALVTELYEELQPAISPAAVTGAARPAVTAPIYGRAYASATLPTNNPGNTPLSGWLSQVNLDPRYRAIAGIGSQLIQDNQEEYTNRAWEQVRDVLAANMNLRGMQSGLQTTRALHNHHLPLTGSGAAGNFAARTAEPTKDSAQTSSLSPESKAYAADTASESPDAKAESTPASKNGSPGNAGTDDSIVAGGTSVSMENYGLHLTGLAFTRVLVPGSADSGDDLTVQEVIRQSAMPMAAFSPAFRRITKPFGRYQTSLAGRPRRLTDPEPPVDVETLLERGTTIPQRDSLLTLLNEGVITPAQPKPTGIRAYQFDDARVDDILKNSAAPSTFLLLVKGQYVAYTSKTEGGGEGETGTIYTRFIKAYNNFRKAKFNTADYKPPVLDLEKIKQALIEGTKPEEVYLARANRALRLVPHYGTYVADSALGPITSAPGPGTANPQARMAGPSTVSATGPAPAPRLQEVKPVMAYPVFKDAMGEILRTKHPDLFMPGIDDFPANGLTTLSVNREFIEAYLLGLNHALGSELLWRGFPTDLRGSYFRQFWDVSEQLSTSTSDSQTPEELADAEESLRDITPLASWGTQALGTHSDNPSAVRLAVRADLLKRYPNTVISALSAKKENDVLTPNFDEEYVFPIQRMTLGQDILVLTFPLSEADAKGQVVTEPNGPYGFFFIFQERPGEPQFGLDDWAGSSPAQFPVASWDNLSWQHLAAEEGTVISIPAANQSDTAFQSITDSAKLAYAFFQQPFMVAIHAQEMIVQ